MGKSFEVTPVFFSRNVFFGVEHLGLRDWYDISGEYDRQEDVHVARICMCADGKRIDWAASDYMADATNSIHWGYIISKDAIRKAMKKFFAE